MTRVRSKPAMKVAAVSRLAPMPLNISSVRVAPGGPAST